MNKYYTPELIVEFEELNEQLYHVVMDDTYTKKEWKREVRRLGKLIKIKRQQIKKSLDNDLNNTWKLIFQFDL